MLGVSTLIIPNIGLNFFGINFEDLPFIFIFILLLIHFIINKSWKSITTKQIWGYLVSLFIFFAIISSRSNFFNTTNLRFIIYILFGFLVFGFCKFNNNISKLVKNFFLPTSLIILCNFVIYLIKYTSPDKNNGWLASNIWPSNLLNSGRLAGLQGGGPNVLGALLGLSTLVFIYLFLNSGIFKLKLTYFFILIISVFCLFLTFSRGSYLAILISSILFLYLHSKDIKIVLISGTILFTLGSIFLYFGNSQILLKDSDRSLLSDIAFSNLNIFKGVGGGRYLTEIYGSYLLALDPELIAEQYNLSIDQIASGIIPQGFEGQGNFTIASSGGGYEVLQAANIADKCTGNRSTCQNVRVNPITLVKFLSVTKGIDFDILTDLFYESKCFPSTDDDHLLTRGEYACVNYFVNKEYLARPDSRAANFKDSTIKENKYFGSLIRDSLFKQCEEKDFEKQNFSEVVFGCPSRKLAIGELAALTEDLAFRYESVSLDEFTKFCSGCDLREVKGWLKIEFDRYDKILPRSVFRFYTSKNGFEWVQLGYDHTPGFVVDFTDNTGVLEIGGWVDGQSFGNTWLGAEISEITINTSGSSKNIKFIEDDQNKTYNIYEIANRDEYISNVGFTSFGVVMHNPTKYWLSIENDNFDFHDDFEILLKLKVPEIIWEEAVLVSLTSGFDKQTASWKWVADDGRLFFTWTNDVGEFKYLIGDRSLRSGLLYADEAFFSSGSPPTVDSAHLSQLTTSHNGFLTYAVEYGLFLSIILFCFFLYSIRIGVTHISNESNLLVTLMSFLLIQNFTNDLIYAPDTAIYIWLIVGMLFSLERESV